MLVREYGFIQADEYEFFKEAPVHAKAKELALGGVFTYMVLFKEPAKPSNENTRAFICPALIKGVWRPEHLQGTNEWDFASVTFSALNGDGEILGNTVQRYMVEGIIKPPDTYIQEAYFKRPPPDQILAVTAAIH